MTALSHRLTTCQISLWYRYITSDLPCSIRYLNVRRAMWHSNGHLDITYFFELATTPLRNSKLSAIWMICNMMSTIERDVISTLTFYFHRTWCQLFIPHRIDIDQGSLLITRITFNLDMDKNLHPSWCVGWSIYLLPRFNDGAVKFGLVISNLSSSDSSSSANTTRSSIIIIIITNNHSLKWNPRQDQRCSNKNIENIQRIPLFHDLTLNNG